jgi:hypothetical protein
MKSTPDNQDRRSALDRASRLLAAIAVVAVTGQALPAAAKKKKKGKADKEDFYFQTEPGEKGRSCSGCANFEPYSEGNPHATVALLEPGVAKDSEKGTCALLIGEVCTHCYCQGWADKKTEKKHTEDS